MKKILTLLFLFSAQQTWCQEFMKIEKLDTIQVSGNILFIDSLDNMSPVYGRMGSEDYLPDYLVLLQVDQIQGLDLQSSKLVFRTKGIDTLQIGKAISCELQVTIRESFGANLGNESISTYMDSLYENVGIVELYFHFMEKRPGLRYNLKEENKYQFNLINKTP